MKIRHSIDAAPRCFAEIDLQAITHNIAVFQALHPTALIMPILKADGYGHGAIPLAVFLQSKGFCHFGVATLEEAIALRHANIHGEILVLGYVEYQAWECALAYDVTITIVDEAHGTALIASHIPLKAHIKIDTGMHRIGIQCEASSLLDKLYNSALQITGIYSHLAASDSNIPADIAYTSMQCDTFHALITQLRKTQKNIGIVHLLATNGAANIRNYTYDMIRLGMGMYGVLSSKDASFKPLPLKPALQLHATITSIRQVAPHESVGYGHSCMTSTPRRVAAVSIGFCDGIPRALSNIGFPVLVHGILCPIISNICMDQMMIDITAADAQIGDIITLINQDTCSSYHMADAAQTTTVEILSRLGTRINRYYV